MITEVIEDYLKAIYKLSQKNSRVTTTDIAKMLHISPASVSSMMKKLSKMRLIYHQSYQGVELLPAGEKIALEVLRHHRLLELYLKEALGYSWDSVHEEAEKLEHHISEEFEEKIYEALGRPQFDPHGDPIPTKDGKLNNRQCNPLSVAEPGDIVTISRVDDGDPELLRYLGNLGLTPKVQIEVLDKAPFNGPFTIQLGKKKHVLGRNITENIYIEKKNTI